MPPSLLWLSGALACKTDVQMGCLSELGWILPLTSSLGCCPAPFKFYSSLGLLPLTLALALTSHSSPLSLASP